jgi:hypothetical protein
MSSAVVAGAVALLRDSDQKLNPETIRALLQLGASGCRISGSSSRARGA